MTYKTRIDPAATAFTTSPWAYNGKLFCLSEEGQTFVIATGEKFQLLHVNELDDMAQASPALVGERLLIRTEHRLYSIRRKDKPNPQCSEPLSNRFDQPQTRVVLIATTDGVG